MVEIATLALVGVEVGHVVVDGGTATVIDFDWKQAKVAYDKLQVWQGQFGGAYLQPPGGAA